MKVAILGFGVVGSGAYETIKDADCGLTVKYILDKRSFPGYEDLVTSDYDKILNDPEVEIVAEAIGGLHPAYEFVSAALRAGKHVISANKHLICHAYRELHELAAANNCQLRFTPSAGGGIPWLMNLRRQKRCDKILSLRGIMNGTTNYILDAMHNLGSDFADVLATAQQLGYAEADPSADIDGWDVRRKCAISASLAFDAVLTEQDVPTFGIRTVTREDMAYFDSINMVCKLLAFAKEVDGKIVAYVEPTLLPADAVEAAIGSNFNCISLTGRRVGTLSFIGQGAGKDPTGSALVQDMLDILDGGYLARPSMDKPVMDHGICAHSYYIRTTAPVPEEWILCRAEGAVITHPLTLKAIHDFADNAVHIDSQLFVAGLEDNTEV